MERVSLKVHRDMLIVAQSIARESDITVGQLVRDLLAKEISRHKNARPPIKADEQLIAPLRARLAPLFAHSQSWQELQQRLHKLGYALHPAGGGLALHTYPTGERVCKASELGFSYARLVEKLQSGFPGHSHTWIEERVLNRQRNSSDTEFCVIEDDFPEL